MDTRANLIAVTLYSVLGVAVLFGFYLVASFGPWGKTPATVAGAGVVDLGAAKAVHIDTKGAEVEDDLPKVQDQQRVTLMKVLLDQRSTQLQAKSSLLKKKTEEFERLKKQYDDAVGLAIELLAADSEKQDDGETMDVLATQLAEAEKRQADLLAQLDDVKAELGDTYLELAEMREQSDEVMTQMMEADLLVQAATTQTFRRMGATALPALIETLRSEHADVRTWGCRMIAAIGPDARDAADGLTAALSDSNPGVRTAARDALQAISE